MLAPERRRRKNDDENKEIRCRRTASEEGLGHALVADLHGEDEESVAVVVGGVDEDVAVEGLFDFEYVACLGSEYGLAFEVVALVQSEQGVFRLAARGLVALEGRESRLLIIIIFSLGLSSSAAATTTGLLLLLFFHGPHGIGEDVGDEDGLIAGPMVRRGLVADDFRRGSDDADDARRRRRVDAGSLRTLGPRFVHGSEEGAVFSSVPMVPSPSGPLDGKQGRGENVFFRGIIRHFRQVHGGNLDVPHLFSFFLEVFLAVVLFVASLEFVNLQERNAQSLRERLDDVVAPDKSLLERGEGLRVHSADP